MKISELTSALNKVSQVAGDCDIVLRDEQTSTTTAIAYLDLHIDPAGTEAASVVQVVHATPTTPAPSPAAAPATPEG